jgi:hypothetical protein
VTAAGPDAPGGALAFARAALLLGAYRWFEHRLFVVAGAAAVSPGDGVDPALRVFLDTASRRHAAHAAEFADRLPVVAHLDPDALSVPLPAMAAADGALGALLGAADPAGRPAVVLDALAGALLPLSLATYRAHRAVTTAATDGPTRRALDLVIAEGTGEAAAAAGLSGAGPAGGASGPVAEAARSAGAVTGFLADGHLATL